MAPSMELPEINMTSLQEADILQSYLLLFQYMIQDFVHKDDLFNILSTNSLIGVANPPDYVLKGSTVFASARLDAAARARNVVYSKAAKTGAVAQGKTLSALEALTK